MTTDKLPEAVDSRQDVPTQHSVAEKVIKDANIESVSKGGRNLKFVPKSRNAKISLVAAGFLSIVVILLLVVMLSSGGSNSSNNAARGLNPVEIKELKPNNNSPGYNPSTSADFGQYSLNLNYPLPSVLKSENMEIKVGQQASWGDGFAIMATSVDRDYRPASEFDYKKIAEAGDELVRVNLLVGNASDSNMLIGYSDLALYAEASGMTKTQPERISEDIYSPRDGQLLGAKQTAKISVHYRVERGQGFYITRSKTFQQKQAKTKNGEEKTPTLSLRINL